MFNGLLNKSVAIVPNDLHIHGFRAYHRDINNLLDIVLFGTVQSLPESEEPDDISDAGGSHPSKESPGGGGGVSKTLMSS